MQYVILWTSRDYAGRDATPSGSLEKKQIPQFAFFILR